MHQRASCFVEPLVSPWFFMEGRFTHTHKRIQICSRRNLEEMWSKNSDFNWWTFHRKPLLQPFIRNVKRISGSILDTFRKEQTQFIFRRKFLNQTSVPFLKSTWFYVSCELFRHRIGLLLSLDTVRPLLLKHHLR